MNIRRLLKAIGKALLLFVGVTLFCVGIVWISEHCTPNQIAVAAGVLLFAVIVAMFYYIPPK